MAQDGSGIASIFKRGGHKQEQHGAPGEEDDAAAADNSRLLEQHLNQLSVAWAAPKTKCVGGRVHTGAASVTLAAASTAAPATQPGAFQGSVTSSSGGWARVSVVFYHHQLVPHYDHHCIIMAMPPPLSLSVLAHQPTNLWYQHISLSNRLSTCLPLPTFLTHTHPPTHAPIYLQEGPCCCCVATLSWCV